MKDDDERTRGDSYPLLSLNRLHEVLLKVLGFRSSEKVYTYYNRYLLLTCGAEWCSCEYGICVFWTPAVAACCPCISGMSNSSSPKEGVWKVWKENIIFIANASKKKNHFHITIIRNELGGKELRLNYYFFNNEQTISVCIYRPFQKTFRYHI